MGKTTAAHKGQSMLLTNLASAPSSPNATIFMPPAPALAQTICVSVGLTIGEAMAIPMNSAKHTSTRRAMNLCECALNMSDIIADEISA